MLFLLFCLVLFQNVLSFYVFYGPLLIGKAWVWILIRGVDLRGLGARASAIIWVGAACSTSLFDLHYLKLLSPHLSQFIFRLNGANMQNFTFIVSHFVGNISVTWHPGSPLAGCQRPTTLPRVGELDSKRPPRLSAAEIDAPVQKSRTVVFTL